MEDIFVYGTLRVGCGNFKNFNRRYGIEVIEEGVPLRKYAMASIGIPFTYYTGNQNDVVYGDVLRVDEECKAAIDRMELGAGYDIHYIRPEDHPRTYRAYLYEEDRVPRGADLVTTGNFKDIK